MDAARRVLRWLREGVDEPAAIVHELHAINADIEAYRSKQSSFIAKSLALFREPPLFARLWRAFLLQFMAQMCGAAAMKYYLPTLLKALGLGTRLALMAGAVEMTAKIGMTVVEMWIIDRFGRKTCLAGGSVVMAVAMLVGCVSTKDFNWVLTKGIRSMVSCPWHSQKMSAQLQTPCALPSSSSTPWDTVWD